MIAITALLVAVLIPALSEAREVARRVVCAANLNQLGLAAELYIHDNEGHYMQNGSNGAHLHTMTERVRFREDYLNGTQPIFYCPSAEYRHGAEDPYDQFTKDDFFFGYVYFGGWGRDSESGLYGRRSWARNEYLTTPTRQIAEEAGNATERPLFADASGNNALKDYVRESQVSAPAYPTVNHRSDNPALCKWSNIRFVDGHLEGYGNTIDLPMRFGGFGYTWGSYHWD